MNQNFRRLAASAALLLFVLSLSGPAYSQAGFFAIVSGTVTDSTGAVIPGVTIRATGVDTGVVTNTISNEAGAYTFNNLNPGKYTLSATLPGFQSKNYTDVNLSQNTTYRYNFELTVAGVNTEVAVSVSAETLLATSGASIGTVLQEEKVRDLPLVGNNVLNLITVLSGIENIAPDNQVFGRTATTFAGVTADNVSIVRDGIQVQDNRYPNGINSVTTINPDLVGEIRLILTPVDVEIGRGNGTIQYSTRSGTNRYTGSAVWTVRNTALDPNSWTNNRNQAPLTPGGPAGLPLQPNWTNIHQGTVSFGGPIVRNKTFFFGLFDMNRNRSRALSNFPVLTPCARLGIFRYFNGWNNEDIYGDINTTQSNLARYPSVLPDGTPINPMNNGVNTPGGLPPGYDPAVSGPYNPALQHISVFGRLQQPEPMAADCSNANVNKQTLVPNGVTITAPGAPIAADGSNGWDLYRKQFETTGFLARQLGFVPLPNNYETGDGLNTAGYRILRGFKGLDNLFGVGEGTGDRFQWNVKVDHNFSSNHKANVNVTYERVSSDDVAETYPGTFGNTNFRRPLVLSAGFTSTLSPTLLNEARFGMRRQGTNVVAPWDGDQEAEVRALLPSDINGFPVIPDMRAFGTCNPYFGARPPGVGCGPTDTAVDLTPTYTYSDTLSWTKGAHAMKFGGEFRDNSSAVHQTGPVFFGTPMYARPSTGSITGTGQGNSGATDINRNNPAMPGLIDGNAQAVGNATNARTLANWFAGSLGNLVHSYTLSSPDQINFQDPSQNRWTDIRTQEFFQSKLVQREFNAFFKDDWKITRDLTLNMGVRWDYFGVPYLESGLTNTGVGGAGSAAAFGVSGDDFTDWMNPGIRGQLTTFEFVGKNSPNPDKTIYPNDYNNWSPAVGFSWNLPWWGEGRTTVRGGYQITYQGGGRFSTVQPLLAGAPGSTVNATPNWTNVYRDLASITVADLPIPAPNLPLQPVPLYVRSATYSPFDDNYVNPYTQNFNLSVTRTLNRNVTLDVRYVGTVSRKQYSTTNLNTANWLYNGLLENLDRIRTGTELNKAPGDPKDVLDRMFQGINLCAPTTNCVAGTYGAIGTTVGGVYQSAALQMRSSTNFQTNLANGSYDAITGAIANLNYSQAGGANPGLPAIPAGTVAGVLRYANTVTYPGEFPENFIITNPQFNNVNMQTNSGYGNYHSLQVQTSLRPIHGFSGQVTYAWSKNLGVAGGFTNPVDRAADYTTINNNPGHSLRTNGTMELPLGPNKLFFGNSSGWVARAIERWQLGLIYNLSSGAPVSVTANNMLYANGVPDVVYPVNFNDLKGVRWGIRNGNFLEGRYFDNNDMFVKIDDPQCATVTSLQNLNNVVGGVQTRCTMDALAMAVPAGTAGAVDRVFADGQTRPSVVVLQHPQPGKRGTFGRNTVIGLGSYRFDANLGKTFQISESKSVQVRFDAGNVLNHPQPAAPTLSITGNDYFGRIASKSGGRTLQGQLRFNF